MLLPEAIGGAGWEQQTQVRTTAYYIAGERPIDANPVGKLSLGNRRKEKGFVGGRINECEACIAELCGRMDDGELCGRMDDGERSGWME